MQSPGSGPRSKLPQLLLALLTAPSAVLTVACGSGADVVSNVALPSRQSTGFVDGVDVGAAPQQQSASAAMALTPAQRGYLDALAEAGIRPSSELRALSIGSSVCQARAAGQSDQAVRDYVAPMVRSDLADANVSSPTPAATAAADAVNDKAIDDYIRIATLRLC